MQITGPYPDRTARGEKCYRIEWVEEGRLKTLVSPYGGASGRTAAQAKKILNNVKTERNKPDIQHQPKFA